MEAQAGYFQCAACGRQFRWKAELVGRSLRCPCGATMRCPDSAPGEDQMYDLTPQPARAAASEPPLPAQPRTQTLGYQTPRKAMPLAQRGEGVDTETLKNQYIPLWLLGGGVAVEFVSAMILHRHDLPAAMLNIFLEIVVGTVLMLLGVLIAAKIRGIQIGSFGTAALRLAAISIAPTALGHILLPVAMMIPLLGGLVLFGFQFVLYFALLGALFDLDQSDTWVCVMVIFLINLGVFFLLQWAPWHH